MFSQGVLALVLPLKVESLGYDTKINWYVTEYIRYCCDSHLFIADQSYF